MQDETNATPGMEAGGWRQRLGSPEQIVANVAFVVLLAAVAWGVLSRHVVTTPSAWVEEVTAFAYCWLIFIGAAEVHRRAQHVGVDILTAMLPAALRNALASAIDVFVIVLAAYVAWLGMRQAVVSHSSTTSMLRLPLSIGYVGLTLGFLLIALRGLQRVARVALGRAGG